MEVATQEGGAILLTSLVTDEGRQRCYYQQTCIEQTDNVTSMQYSTLTAVKSEAEPNMYKSSNDCFVSQQKVNPFDTLRATQYY